MKRIYIESLGCPKNLVDSELISYLLSEKKYKIVDNHTDADTILINTCGFIRQAREESIQYILNYKQIPGKEIVVFGCMVDLYKDELIRNIPEVKYFYSTKEFFNKYFHLQYNKDMDFSSFNSLTPQSYSYIKISDGCSRRCSYCTIPLIKGKQFSRPVDNIIKEIKKKVRRGFKELNLIAQDMINFGKDNRESLSILLKRIGKINYSFKVRLLYLYPDKRLIDIVKQVNDSEKIINYLDIPIQHISSKILRSMKRPDKINFYKNLFYKIREINPEFILRSTFIIGFPGEAGKDFQELLQFMKDIRFNWAGFFAYSDEANASSYKLPDKKNKKTVSKRLAEAISLQREITSEWLNTRLNKYYDVVVDDILKEDQCILTRSYAEAPEIDGNIIIKYHKKIKVGDRFRVRIKNSLDYDLEGEIGKQ